MLIDKLKKIQEREGLTDGQVANELGINRVSWNRIKCRRAKFGNHFLMSVRQKFPELKDEIDIFLSGEITNSNNIITDVNSSPYQKPRSQKLGGFWVWLISKFLGIKFTKL